MHKIRCLVVDDEPIARKGIKTFIDKISFLDFMGFSSNTDEMMECLKQGNIDLIFMDIEMPGTSGMEILKSELINFPMVIFITAYQEFALESYEVNAVDYLLKPVSFGRFYDAANKALKEFQTINDKSTVRDFLFLKSDGKHRKVNFEDIIYISGMQNYSRLHLKNDKTLIVRYALKAVLKMLPEPLFLPIHKSYLINTRQIESLAATTVNLKNSGQLPIGRTYREKVLKLLSEK
ncbi:MAG: response regulator [Bacteroidetes bacterium]|nr:response regulator [Bacteroidota bacterium]